MTIETFAKKITDKSVDAKMKAQNGIQKCIDDNVAPDGTPLTPSAKAQLQKLVKWLGVNMLVGEELCPASTVNTY